MTVAGGGALDRFLDRVERAGNRLPRPFMIFVYLAFSVVLLFLAALPQGSPLRDESGSLIPSPLLDGVVVLILLFFLAVALAYGITSRA